MAARAHESHALPELLQIIPELTEFRIDRSLVCLAIRDEQIIGAVRFDAPMRGSGEALSHAVMGVLSRFPSGTCFVFALFSPSVRPHAGFVARLRQAVHAAGYHILALWWQSPEAWGDYLSGRTFARDCASELETGAIRNGDAVTDSALEVEPYECAADVDINRAEPYPFRERAELWLLAEEVLERCARSASIQRLLGALASPELRDNVLIRWAYGESLPTEHNAAPVDSNLLRPSRWMSVLVGRGTHGPEHARVRLALTACVRLRLLSPTTRIDAIICTLQAWLHWSVGESSRSMELLEVAVRRDPHYELAGLLRNFIGNGAIPDWAFTGSA
ncbi:MAG: DUF4192 family protein [Agromyces sp.]